MTALAPLSCSPALARRLGARPVAIVTGGVTHPGCLAFLRHRTADAIASCGEIPILTDGGPVYAWPLQPGARNTGAGL